MTVAQARKYLLMIRALTSDSSDLSSKNCFLGIAVDRAIHVEGSAARARRIED
jgi:hypothetical protein